MDLLTNILKAIYGGNPEEGLEKNNFLKSFGKENLKRCQEISPWIISEGVPERIFILQDSEERLE